MQRKHVKMIVYGAFAVLTFVIILIWAQRGRNREQTAVSATPTMPQQQTRSKYDDKIEAYREMEKNQRIISFNTGSSYFDPDSIMGSDGRMMANPDKKKDQVVREDLFKDQERQFQEGEARIAQIQNTLKSTDPKPEKDIVYHVAQGTRIQYDKDGRAYTKNGYIDDRAMGQAAVDQYLAEKSASGTEASRPAMATETEAQRKKRRIEESMGIRAIDGAKIPAVVHTTQVIGNGQEAVFRITQDTRYGDIVIPQHTLISAVTKISTNRVHFTVGSVRVAGRYYSVSLTGYSPDGGEGLALNISNEKKALNSEVKDAALSGVQRVIGSTAVGSALSGIVRGVSRASERETNMTVKLIDNQPINFFAE